LELLPDPQAGRLNIVRRWFRPKKVVAVVALEFDGEDGVRRSTASGRYKDVAMVEAVVKLFRW
jgi:hypothetical protein